MQRSFGLRKEPTHGGRFANGGILAAAAGTFGSLDTALNIAFPDLVADFDLTVGQLQWVVILFVAASGGLLVPAGMLGDRIGYSTAVLAGAAISVGAMTACALAPTFELFLGARVLQGVGTATLMASAPALATAASPPDRRAHAVGIFQSAAAIGLAAGPIVGGLMVLSLGWRGVFWFRVPIAVLLVGLALRTGSAQPIGSDGAERHHRAGVVGGIRQLSRVLGLAVRREVVIANLATFIANGSMFATWLLVPALLVDERGVSVLAGGLILAVSPMMTALAAGRAGQVVDRIGADQATVGGLLLIVAGLAALAATGWGWPTSTVIVALGLVGFGLGLFSVPNMASVMAALPASDQGAAGAINLMMRTLGIVAGAAWHARLFDRVEVSRSFDVAFGMVFAVAAALAGAAIVMVVLVPWVSRLPRRPNAA